MTCGRPLRSWVAAIVMAGSLFAAPACAAPRGRLYVRVEPPAPVFEARVVRPSPRHVWVAGYYRWTGGAYFWVPGRWELPPRPRAVWTPGHWMHDRHGWYFVEGHWRR